MVRIKTSKGTYDYEKSTRKGKKLMVTIDGVTIHFGTDSMQHYKDKTKLWSELDHNNEERRRKYLARSKGILNGMDETTFDNPLSANYHSREILWT